MAKSILGKALNALHKDALRKMTMEEWLTARRIEEEKKNKELAASYQIKARLLRTQSGERSGARTEPVSSYLSRPLRSYEEAVKVQMLDPNYDRLPREERHARARRYKELMDSKR